MYLLKDINFLSDFRHDIPDFAKPLVIVFVTQISKHANLITKI